MMNYLENFRKKMDGTILLVIIFRSHVERMAQVTLLLTTGTIKRASSALLDPAD